MHKTSTETTEKEVFLNFYFTSLFLGISSISGEKWWNFTAILVVCIFTNDFILFLYNS